MHNKKYFVIFFLIVLLAPVACNKKIQIDKTERVVLHFSDNSLDASVSTKANVPSTLYWAATIGNFGSVWQHNIIRPVNSVSINNNILTTDIWQGENTQEYNYYVTDVEEFRLYNTQGGNILNMSLFVTGGTNDAVFGAISSMSVNPCLVLRHLLAKVGTVRFRSLPNGFTISSYELFIKTSEGYEQNSGIEGYCIPKELRGTPSDYWEVTVPLTSFTKVTSEPMYVIPGYYDVRIDFQGSDGKKYIQIAEKVNFVAGKQNNITATIFRP